MEESKKIHFRIPLDKKDCDLIFEEIKQIPNYWSPKRITDKIHEKLSLTLILGRLIEKETIKAIPIYRLRIPKPGEKFDETMLSEFSYPPKKFCKMQRCNRNGEQVFYASADPHATFLELSDGVKPGTIAYISKWGIKEEAENFFMRFLFYGIPEDEKNYASIMANGMQEEFHKIFKNMPDMPRDSLSYIQKKFQELFTAKGKEYYHISSAIVRHMFVNGRKKNPNFNMPVIAYPSVAKDKKGVNFVFRKDFVDKYFYLKYIDKVIVNSVEMDKVNHSPISRGIMVDGKIKWMKFRISIDKIDYDSAILSNDEFPNESANLIPIKSNEEVLSCCPEHRFSLKSYLHDTNINDDFLLNAIRDVPMQGLDNENSDTRPNMFFLKVEHDLFYNQNFGEEGRVKFIGVPVTYKLEYVA